MKPAEKRSAPEPDSATHLRSRGAGVHHASTSAVAEKQAWDRASAAGGLLLAEDKKRALTAAKINKEVKAANERLKKRKQELAQTEDVLQAKHAIKTFSLEDLGRGCSRGGAAAARKRRWESLGSTGPPRPGLVRSTEERLQLVERRLGHTDAWGAWGDLACSIRCVDSASPG